MTFLTFCAGTELITCSKFLDLFYIAHSFHVMYAAVVTRWLCRAPVSRGADRVEAAQPQPLDPRLPPHVERVWVPVTRCSRAVGDAAGRAHSI